MEQHPDVGFAYGRVAYLFPEGLMSVLDSEPRDKPWRIVAGEDLLKQFCREGVNHVPGSGVMVRTVAQKLAGHYRPQLPHTTDFEMWMRLARLGSAARTEAYTVISRLHSFSRKTLAGGLYTCERPPAQPWLDEAAFESFFEHEGPSLPDAARLRRLAKRGLAERAYWAAVAHLCRRQPGASRDLFKFALSRRPSTAILPPVSYLFRRRSAFERIIETACEMMRWQHAPAKPAQADG
jgi:hypothetical protein